MADKILFELVDVNNLSSYSHGYVNGRFSILNQTPESTYVLSALRRLADDGFFDKKNGSSESFHINGKTLDFKNYGGYKELIKEEKRKGELKAAIEELGLKSAQSVIDTNDSIQTLNTRTSDFYNHQRKINNAQRLLTIAIFFTGAVSAVVATCEYYKPTTNSDKHIVIDTAAHNQQLRQLESRIQSQTNRFETFEKAVKDSLKMK